MPSFDEKTEQFKERKVIQTLQNTVWQFLIKSPKHKPCFPGILLVICPR
jgi:carbon monoxide dehydrogenase subunit G